MDEFCNSSRNTLVIEDDADIRDTMKLVLESEGYTVYTAADGREGLEVLKTIPRPCLILLDLMMPIMNGWEFVEIIEKDVMLATIPIVVVSAFSERAGNIRAQNVLKKPVDISVLFKVLDEFCGKKKAA